MMSAEAKTITRADIVREARACIGVPFKHQHSDPRTGGLDCRGLLEWVLHRLTGRPLPAHNYCRQPSGREFYERVAAECEEVPLGDAREGDVVMIQFPRAEDVKHAGILARGPYELMLIHAFERIPPGRVIEEPFRGWLVRCARHSFRFPGVAD